MIIILAAVASLAAAGPWLRWAVVPVTIAYTAGRLAERQCARLRASEAGHPVHRPHTIADWPDERDG
jgi:hypothetical protein